MAFTIYSSSDSGAPTLSGLSGSLLTVLDAVLVNGYGSKSPAGWTKPLPNTGSYGLYRQGSGSMYYMFVYESGSAIGAEAFVTGWDSITAITNGAVTGSNPFPTNSQLNLGSGIAGGAGAVIIRKSSVPTSTSRTWIIFADARTVYIFIKTTDVAINNYYAFAFGDFYSLRSGSSDTSNCLIIGRSTLSSSVQSVDRLDNLSTANISSALLGHFAAHTFNGSGGSITLSKHGDGIKGTTSGFLNGNVPYLNGVDNGLYLSPVWIVEASNLNIRGRMRGFWHVCHASSSFTDGQVFTGSVDFPGRTFQSVTPGATNSSYFIETSDTLETN